MFTVLIFGILVGLATSQTIVYEKCEAQDFETKVCEFSKSLNEQKPD
jgi:hypothetical protein